MLSKHPQGSPSPPPPSPTLSLSLPSNSTPPSSPLSLPSLPTSPSPQPSPSPPLSPPLFDSPPTSSSPLSPLPSPILPPLPPIPFSTVSPPLISSPPLPSISTGVVSKSVLSFPPDSAPGPTGLRPNHLKEGIRCPSPSTAANFLLRLTQFTSLLTSGLLPQAIAPHLCGASLLASRKKSGGLRPIAIGEVFRRLASKCLVSLVSPQLESIFHPYQAGVGSPN
uniref:Reverse transcriptase domain-containing protein n=1 Tax=Amphimedon queenslandica TaxID=400682 RepID=A0A1X7SDZ4_AMPQE